VYRLPWVQEGGTLCELRTADLQTIASARGLLSDTFSAGGRTFTQRRVTRSAWPGIAETISRDRLGLPSHELKRQADDRDRSLHTQLADETGIPILYMGGRHIQLSAGAYIKFPGQRWLRFPVRGTARGNAIMTAVDQAGKKVARYRLARTKRSSWVTTEIAVHPSQLLTDELALVIAVSAPWLASYFIFQGGG
jgi:hypothetical protein